MVPLNVNVFIHELTVEVCVFGTTIKTNWKSIASIYGQTKVKDAHLTGG
jgi:hypothetical protein